MTEREAQLTAELAHCKAQLEQARLERERFERENQLLRQKIDLLVRHVFGSKSERLNPAQMELLLGGESNIAPLAQEPLAPATPAQPSRSQRREHAPRLPENLPVVEEIIRRRARRRISEVLFVAFNAHLRCGPALFQVIWIDYRQNRGNTFGKGYPVEQCSC